eukprot:TRINITY_DN7353_c0_g1_i1.p1 TRINITY_DN7353_c0_g1~~TRINITY_DN7353_c0_g1_i1.p1  ORF type:complete len:535 (-),score=207.22 TRINITY_DN7353_c0_g1_i1:164-1723(-)
MEKEPVAGSQGVRDAATRARNVERCRSRNVLLPTFAEMQEPQERVPPSVKERLRAQPDMEAIDPVNLFRITWHNVGASNGAGAATGEEGACKVFASHPNYLVLPPALTGVASPIIVMLGTFFPTGAHKVGATYWPLVSRLIDGTFDASRHRALFPSTGNYCRGGAFDSCLLGCPAIAVLPEGMSKERFRWLEEHGAEVVATPGTESNVKEVFDKTHELAKQEDVVVLDQFANFANPLWHYGVTGHALEKAYRHYASERGGDKSVRLSGCFFTQGSGGCLTGSARWLRQHCPEHLKVGAGEALQCPTLLENGHGEHRIEGIGDKHVPWILDPRNIDVVAAIDDDACMRVMRLFNTPSGHKVLRENGVSEELVEKLPLLGISGIANMLGCIKMAKYYEYNEQDVLVTLATDAMNLYTSRLEEQRLERGEYSDVNAAVDFELALRGVRCDAMEELTHVARRRIHNLKYFTWVEQQGKSAEQLTDQWKNHHEYWDERFSQQTLNRADELIRVFNAEVAKAQAV